MPEINITIIVIPRAINEGDEIFGVAALHVTHLHPDSRGVYAAGVYIANLRFWFAFKSPGAAATVHPRSSKIRRVYVSG